MADPAASITIWEIVDTAVKIGLGAAVGGVASYFITKLKYKNDIKINKLKHKIEIENQAITRKRELIEILAKEVQIFWDAYRKFYLSSIEYHKLPTEKSFGDLKSKEEGVEDKVNLLSSAQALALLLNIEAVNSSLSQFIRKTESYMHKVFAKGTEKNLIELKGLHNEVLGIRTSFYKELSSAFKSKVI